MCISHPISKQVEVEGNSVTNGKEDNHFFSFDSETHQHSNNGSIPTYVCEIYVEPKPLDISFNIKVTDCEGVLDPDFCSEILPRDFFNWWGKALCESALLASEKFYCLYQDCSVLLVNDGETSIQRSRYPLCKRVFCVQCNVAWHQLWIATSFRNLTLASDAVFVDLATRKKWRQCPNCKMLVGKSFGCHHVKCRSVHASNIAFNWL
ncbi:hypothetical protein CXB51_035899 [Gossypium anomalum]|uniref:IBR domain-containing protein n=1 Tax=Gossypium anomalum TaxID=47600 RepID=A0A8J5Y5K3_9ROSI|nr:hypothetical protein CXB51_035899 [Gossypium anomalum]